MTIIELWLEWWMILCGGTALTVSVIGIHGCVFLFTGLEKWYWQIVFQLGTIILGSGPICILAWKALNGGYG